MNIYVHIIGSETAGSGHASLYKKLPNWFPKWLYHSACLLTSMQVPVASHPHQYLVLSVLAAMLAGGECALTEVLTHTSLID